MKLWSKIYTFYYRWHYQKYSVIECSEQPDRLKDGVCYCLEDDGFAWAVKLKCPCGCGEAFVLNLVGTRPLWKARVSKKRLSISPSIWRTTGCKSHFWIISGRIKWANNYN